MVSIKSKAIIPSIPGDPQILGRALQRIQKNTAQRIRRDFEKTTRTWSRKVKFTVSVKRKANELIVEAGTDDEIYGYVTGGTKPHPIRARNAPYLVFRYPTTAKTKPNVLASGKGFVGSNVASKKEVQHPGTEARNFHVIIAKRYQDNIVKDSNKALRQYLRQRTRP